MEAREHFEAAAQALAAAETPGIAPQLRDERLQSMRNHQALASLADRLDWDEQQKARETVPTDTVTPDTQPASTGLHARNRRELGRALSAMAMLWFGIAIGLMLSYLANSPR